MPQNVNPHLTPEEYAKHSQHLVDCWNKQNPVGSKVWWWRTVPHGPVHETTVESPAYVSPPDEAYPGTPLVRLDGVRVPMFNVRAVNEAERSIVKPVPLDSLPAYKVCEAIRKGEASLDEIKKWCRYLLPGRGSREHLKAAAAWFRAAAVCAEEAYNGLEE